MLKLIDVSYTVENNKQILKNVNLEIDDGKLVKIIKELQTEK